MRLGIIGAGHAGVKASETAADAGAEVVLYSGESVLPYYRPRLVAFAFGQVEAAELDMHPSGWYGAKRIDLRLGTPAERVDTGAGIVVAGGSEEAFDALILATGAGPVILPFMEEVLPGVVPLWTREHAGAIRDRVRRGGHVMVVGGGILGVEAALRAVDAGMTVALVERMERLMPAQFGQAASEVLADHLRKKGVQILLGRSVEETTSGDDGRIVVGLDQNDSHVADVLLVSVGARRDLALVKGADIETGQGIVVDSSLQTSMDRVFACGDIVQMAGVRRCSALEATMQGKTAASNAIARLRGEPLRDYHPSNGAVNFAHKGFELHSVGELVDESSNEVMLPTISQGGYRSVVVKDSVIVGVRMVGTGDEFKDYVKRMEEEEPWN